MSKGNSTTDNLMPRPQRQPRRSKEDRGLPPDQDLRHLVTDYLNRQRKLWPELVKSGFLPEITDSTVMSMVEDFKSRHRGGDLDTAVTAALLKLRLKLGGSYNRYSCENSNPTSINDQLANSLDKAKAENRFVPWSYVYCDYSISGTNPSRQGYSSFKSVLQDPKQGIETTYIDDFTRASRDEIEWWKLASIATRLKKRLIGASDGFDLSAPMSEVMISVFGLLSRLFLKGLKEKVKRGMKGAVGRGTCVGKLSLGFTRQVIRDKNGNVVVDANEQATYVPCVDPSTRDNRVEMYELFVEKNWSGNRIARHFSRLKVDGSDGWTRKAIMQLLRSPTAIGVFIWNKSRREYDPEKGTHVVIKNPRSDWVIYYDPTLAIVPMKWWIMARKKMAAARRKSPLTGRKPSRNQMSASTLFSGTMFCGSCEKELTLIRSATKYKVMGCADDDLIGYILKCLYQNPSATWSGVLRKLRDSGRRCEQKRLVAIFKNVVQKQG